MKRSGTKKSFHNKGVLNPALGFFGALASDSSSNENSLSSKNSFYSETREEEEEEAALQEALQAARAERKRAAERDAARAAAERDAVNPTARELYDAEIEYQNTLQNNHDRLKTLAGVKGRRDDGMIASALHDNKIYERFLKSKAQGKLLKNKDQGKPAPVIPDYIFPNGLVVRQDPETGRTHILEQNNGISTNKPSRSTNAADWAFHDDRFFGGKTRRRRKRKTTKRKTTKRKTTKRTKKSRRCVSPFHK